MVWRAREHRLVDLATMHVHSLQPGNTLFKKNRHFIARHRLLGMGSGPVAGIGEPARAPAWHD